MILASILCALVVVMTVVPYTGYISIGGVLEITTLHIVTILAGVLLGWKYGAIVGGVWGLTCILRCLMVFPIYKPFGFANVFVAFLPRLCVGLVSGALFAALKKTRMARTPAIMVTAVAGSLTNTVLVLSAMTIYCRIHGVQGYETAGIYTILQSIVASIALEVFSFGAKLSASTPVKGSSKMSASDGASRARISARRRRIPPE